MFTQFPSPNRKWEVKTRPLKFSPLVWSTSSGINFERFSFLSAHYGWTLPPCECHTPFTSPSSQNPFLLRFIPDKRMEFLVCARMDG